MLVKHSVFFFLLLTTTLACVNNSLWVGTMSCTNCNNTLTQYDCFNVTEGMTDGMLSASWWDGDLMNVTETPGTCYFGTDLLCHLNNTWNGTQLWNVRDYTGTAGLNSSNCVVLSAGCPSYTYYRNINVSNTNLAVIFPINSTNYTLDGSGPQVVWTKGGTTSSWPNLVYNTTLNMKLVLNDTCANYPMDVEYGNVSDYQLTSIYDNNLIGWYHMQEGSGNLVENNRLYTASNGTWINIEAAVSWELGRFGYGIHPRGQLGGVNHYVNITEGPGTNMTNNFTMEAWVKRNTFWSSHEPIITKCWNSRGSGCAVAPGADELVLWTYRDAAYYYSYCRLSNNAGTICTTASAGQNWNMSMTDYSYIVCERNSTSLNTYYNGALKASINCAVSLSEATHGQVGLGFRDQTPGFGLNVSIDEVRFHNVSRGPTWINQTYWLTMQNRLNTNYTYNSTFYNYTKYTPTFTQNYGLYSICHYNEETDDAWNMSLIQNGTLATVCQNSVTYTNITNTSACYNFITTEAPMWFKTEGNITGEIYYRTVVPRCNWPCVEEERMYLVNLNNKILVQLTAYINDLVGGFSQSTIRMSHPITSGIREIVSMVFDAEGKAAMNLIKDQYYTVCIEKSDKSEVRCVGFVVVDAQTTKTFGITPTYPTSDSLYSTIMVGHTLNNTALSFTYNDTQNSTTQVIWTVFNASKMSQVLYTNTIVGIGANQAQLTYLNPSNQTIFSAWTSVSTIYGAIGGNSSITINNGYNFFDVGLTSSASSIVYDVVVLVIMVTIAGFAGSAFAGIVAVILSLTLGLFSMVGLWSTGSLALNVVITGTCLSLSLINLWASWRDKNE